jgi:hypothetical protein
MKNSLVEIVVAAELFDFVAKARARSRASVAKFACYRPRERKAAMTPKEAAGDINAMYFMQAGSQYYTTARFAMHAQCLPVCGNLFHHAVEMLLKGGLARKRALSDLKGMRHNLDVMWRAFKVDFPDTTLQRHDKTISSLDKFEEIRYANPDKVPSMMGVADWFGPVGRIEMSDELQTLKQYHLVVREIDDLVADVFKFSSPWSPASPSFLGRNNTAAIEAITRKNAHSEFLTRPAASPA